KVYGIVPLSGCVGRKTKSYILLRNEGHDLAWNEVTAPTRTSCGAQRERRGESRRTHETTAKRVKPDPSPPPEVGHACAHQPRYEGTEISSAAPNSGHRARESTTIPGKTSQAQQGGASGRELLRGPPGV